MLTQPSSCIHHIRESFFQGRGYWQKVIAAPILQYGSNLNFEWQVLNEVCIDQNKLITTLYLLLFYWLNAYLSPLKNKCANLFLRQTQLR